MKLEPIFFILTFIYWVYLIDPFCSRPLKRNYLKLYKERRFLVVCLLSAMVFPMAKLFYTTSDRIIAFSTVPLLFIIVDLLLIKVSIFHLGRPFRFIQRGI